MKKADYTFHKDRKGQIQRQSRQSDGSFWYGTPSNTPIFIPKPKKKK